MLLSLVMVALMIPATVISAFAGGMPEMLVTSLTDLYGGDETRAREDLEAMKDAGLINDKGEMVDLDIRENGESVELWALVQRILANEKVGEITVNGNAATTEQIVKIAQVKSAIETAALLDEEIDATDEHAENLKALLEGIQNGTIDLESAVKNGSLSVKSAKNRTLLGASDGPFVDYTLPENTLAQLTVSADGKSYTGPYVNGSTYDRNYSFAFSYPDVEDKANYIVNTDTSGGGAAANAATTENNVRVDSFDWEKAVYGTNDVRGLTTVTVVLPFKEDDAIQNWIASDMDANKIVDITQNGIGVEMDLPLYGKVNLKYYFAYMFFSYSNRKSITTGQIYGTGVRYPVYLVEQVVNGAERVVAVATRFTAPVNLDRHVRMDTLNLYVERNGTLTYDTEQYTSWGGYGSGRGIVSHMPDWSQSGKDALGYHYWDLGGHFHVTAPVIPGRCFRYYVPSALSLTSNEYQIRPEGSWEAADFGFIKLKNPEHPEFPYVYPRNTAYPERQYDVEYMVNEEMYQICTAAVEKTIKGVPIACLSDTLLFENDPVYPWQTGEDEPEWPGEPPIPYIGSGNDGVNSSTSTLTLRLTLEKEATVSFEYYYNVATPMYGAVEHCTFTVDGGVQFDQTENGYYTEWHPHSFNLSAGTHTLSWSYQKDADDTYDSIPGDQGLKVRRLSIQTEGTVTQPDDDTTTWLASMHLEDDNLRMALRVSDRLNFSTGANGKVIQKADWLRNGVSRSLIVTDTSTDDLWSATLTPSKMTVVTDIFMQSNQPGNAITPNYGEQFNLTFPMYLRVAESDPYLMVPRHSKVRQTIAGFDTDILFSSNLAQYNRIKDGTNYRVELYKVGAMDEDNLDTLPGGAQKIDIPNWGVFPASAENVLTHVTVPGSALDQVGVYALVISCDFSDGFMEETFTTIAYLQVKHAPAKIRLGKLENSFADTQHIPTLTYTLENAAEDVELKYTIQPSGEAVSSMMDLADGVIPFTPEAFEGLKKAYTITVYARNRETDAWSVDSMLLTVYNSDVLKFLVRKVAIGEIGGSTGGKTGDGTEEVGDTLNIDNGSQVGELVDKDGDGAGYQISGYDFEALRADLGLQRVISVNYGSGVWGTISDRMKWLYKEANGNTSDDVTLNHKENGTYADLRNYSYTSYIPTTDFLIVATDDRSEDAPVTITAVHASTGMTQTVNVTVNTLKGRLFFFRFMPKAKTLVTYINGNGEKRALYTNDQGELVVFESSGILGDFLTMSEVEGETYVGTFQPKNLASGERNIIKLEIYPCNNLKLVPISNQTLTILKPDGTPYSGPVTLRAGVYKGGEYCPNIGVRENKEDQDQILRKDIHLTADKGVMTLYYDPTQLVADDGMARGLKYVYEYRINGYQPGYVIVDPLSENPADFIVTLQNLRGSANTPQITRQEYQQYYNGTTPTSYIRNVIDYKENIGISPNFNKSVLYTDIALSGETVGEGEKVDGREGYSTYEGANVVKFAFFTVGGKKLTGQTDLSGDHVKAEQITNLNQLNSATYFIFPFSAVPMLRSTYTMTNENLTADGMDDLAKTPTARIKAVFTRGSMTTASLSMPFGITNVSHQPDLSGSTDGAGAIGKEVRDNLRETTDIGAIFRSINVNDMIRKGFVFLGNLSGVGGDNFINLMILPTQDPAVFRIIAFVGANQRSEEDDDGVSVNFNAEDLAEDMNKLAKELEESGDEKESDSNGEGSIQFNFYGTIILEARAGVADGKWDIAFRGGNVGTNVKGKYEWGQTFMCGPYPAFISFEVGFHADLEVAFGNKDSARAMLLDAALGVSIEAFAGLGFDLSVVAIQLGIYGKIGADVNFLLLTPSDAAPSTGTKLTISGEIGIKLKVKLLFVSYTEKFASTGFNWTKKWDKYDQIKDYWTDEGYGQLFGKTLSGRSYAMFLFADGSAMVAIDGGPELETRDYLELEERVWTGGSSAGKRLLKAAGPVTNALTNVQTNAYPYSHPAFTDDGELFLYISDNDNAKDVESVTSYAVKKDDGYENMGRVDTSEENVLKDLDVVASGTKENAFAAWVKQVDTPRIDQNAKVTNDDIGMMFNATEIYASAYNGKVWTTTQLTENFVADMAPTVASYDNRAIVAWRSMYASSMDAEDGDITSVFDVENNINFRIFNGTEWTDAKIAYNGSTGTVNALDAAMLQDGTALLTYTVRTGEDVTTTETFYTVIDAQGNILTTGRLTNDVYTDANAQVTAVNDPEGGYFVLGWYSEHDAGEGSTVEFDAKGERTVKTVVAHDIRLARINANGSYDIDFPESVGGNSQSGFTSDFHFSAPCKNTDLSNVSLAWSQRKDSDAAEDAGKYQLNAIRFFRLDNVTGLTAPTDIAETSKNYTIDFFDVYTDAAGAVHAILLGSDYDSIKGISFYDSIDLDAAMNNTVSSNSDSPKNLNILDGEAISSLKLATGTFPEISADVSALVNSREVVPGFATPVQFAVKNTGTTALTSIQVKVGTQTKEFTVNLLPNQAQSLLVHYNVPEGAVSDPAYVVSGNGTTLGSGALTLNCPDIGISNAKILQEYEGKRDVQILLSNNSLIPLSGSGKTVKVAFYRDPFHETRIGSEITIPETAYADIDAGTYTFTQTLDVTTLLAGDEIPEGGLPVYIRAWVDGVEEPDRYNNESYVSIQSLVVRNLGAKLTTDSALEEEQGTYTVYTEIRNNSIRQTEVGIPVAILLDSTGKIIARKNLADSLTLGAESKKTLTATFAAADISDNATPASAEIRFISTVSFDLNGGSGDFAPVTTDLDGHIVIPASKPTVPVSDPPVFFRGWYTGLTGGELVTEESYFNTKTTLYARYTPHEHVFEYTLADGGKTLIAKCVSTVQDDCPLEQQDRTARLTLVAPERAATGYGMPQATMVGDTAVLGKPVVHYFSATANGTRGDALEEEPIDPGKYWAEFTYQDGEDRYTVHLVYEIPSTGYSATYATIPNFLRITTLDALQNMAECPPLLALAWIYATPDALSRLDTNYIVYKRGYITRPEGVQYWPYDDATEYAFCHRMFRGDCQPSIVPVSKLEELITSGSLDRVYTMASGTKQVLTDYKFSQVSSQEELETLDSCTALDALTWIIANIGEHPTGQAVFSPNDYGGYRAVQYREGSAEYQSTDARYFFTVSEDEGLPIYIARKNEILNPYLTYTFKYDANGGTGEIADGQFYIKSVIELPSGDAFSKPNLVFNGWNTRADGTGDAYKPGDTLEVLDHMTLYAQWIHVHNWSFTFDESSQVHTATCTVPGCPHGSLTLQPASTGKMYDGQTIQPYVLSSEWTEENGLPLPTVTYYLGQNQVNEAKNAGVYTAVVSLNGHDTTVNGLSITPRPIGISAEEVQKHEGEEDPNLIVHYDAVPGTLVFENNSSYRWKVVSDSDRLYAMSGNSEKGDSTSKITMKVTLTGAGSVTFDYNYGTEKRWDVAYFKLDGEEQFSCSGAGGGWQTYTCNLTAGTHTLEWSYEKDSGFDSNGDFFAVDNIEITNGGTVTQSEENTDPNLTGALNQPVGGILEGEDLQYTVTREEGETVGTYAIRITLGDNPNYDVREVREGKLTILESLGPKQTIEVSGDINATFGDTGLKIDAAITEGDGTLSYYIKSGDAVTVDEEGNLTIVKAGTAVIVVSASQTDNFARTAKTVTVTVSPKAMTVNASNRTVTVNGQPHGITVTATDPAEGYTVLYGTEEGSYTLTESPTLSEEGSITVYYQVTADNYVTASGSVTLRLVTHEHDLSFALGTGEDAGAIIVTCSKDDCPLPNRQAKVVLEAPAAQIVYDGAAHAAVITDEGGVMTVEKVLYAVKGTDGRFGTPTETAPTEVGTYRASLTLGSGDGAVTIQVEYEIRNATLTDVSVAQDGTFTYSGSAQTPAVVTAATSVNNQTVTFTYSLTEDGEYGAMPTFTDVADSALVYFKASAANHEVASGSFRVTMSKANQAAPSAPTLEEATANRIELVATEGYEYSMDGITWQDDVTFRGLTKTTEYTFYQRIKETANYNASPSSAGASISTSNHDHEWGNFTVSGGTITATCANNDGGHSGETSVTIVLTAPTLTVYGGTGSPDATVTNDIEGIDTPTVVYKQGNAVLASAPTGAGTYTASITLPGAATGQESDVTASVTYTIAKVSATVTAQDKSKTYGETDPTLTAVVEGTLGSDTIRYTLTRAEGENAAEYVISVNLGSNPNYDVTVKSAKFTINQKEATVTAQDMSKTYGEADPTLTASVEGIVGSDTIQYTLTRAVGDNAGKYDITVSLGNNPNYKVTVTGATFTIHKAPGRQAEMNANALSYTDTSVWMDGVEGQEYILVPKGTVVNETTSWTQVTLPDAASGNLVLFEDLTPATEFEIYTRTAETVNFLPSAPVKVLAHTSLSSIGYVYDGTLVGTTMTVTPEPGSDTLTFKWYQDDVTVDDDEIVYHSLTEITGAAASSYTFRTEDVGKHIVVKIFQGESEVGEVSTDEAVLLKGTVHFYTDGGTEIDSLTDVTYNTKIEKPANPILRGHDFDGWYWDEELTEPFDFDEDTIVWNETTLYVKWREIDFSLDSVDGAEPDTLLIGNWQWAKGSTEGVVITIKMSGKDTSFEHFVGVKLNGKLLVRDVDYTAEKGSTIVTLKPEILQKMSVEEHPVVILFDNGEVQTKLTILTESGSRYSPKTGDSGRIGLWISLAALSLAGMGVTVLTVKKKKASDR